MTDHRAVNSLIRYEPDTGLFFHRVGRGGVHAGDRAGWLHPNGGIYLRAGGKIYLAHRLAWLLTHGAMPDFEIDHINGNRSDNRLCNLRAATHAQNSRNRKLNANSTTGLKGVSRQGGKFQASIRHDGKIIYLGIFGTPEAAHRAYCAAAVEYHGEFARIA